MPDLQYRRRVRLEVHSRILAWFKSAEVEHLLEPLAVATVVDAG